MCLGLGASVPVGSFFLPLPLGSLLPTPPGSKQLQPPSAPVGAQVLAQQESGGHKVGEPALTPGVSLCPKEHDIHWQIKHTMNVQGRLWKKGKSFSSCFLNKGPCPTYLRCTGPCKLHSPAFMRRDI